jgi:DNA-binding MarR family transcriptional regulator
MSAADGPHHARHDLDETIHQPVRFSIAATLYHAERVDFGFLRRHLDVTESNLSRHLAALEEAGYVLADKVFEGKRARTWLSLTATGRSAFEGHIDALNRIVAWPEQDRGENRARVLGSAPRAR